MVDRVVFLAGIGRDERNAHRVGQLLQGGQVAGDADEARVEVADVLLDLLRRVAVRVDADEDDAQVVPRFRRQQALELAHLRHGGGADVRAEGVAEEHQAPLVLELVHRDLGAVLVDHFQRRQGTALRQQDDAGVEQLGRVGLALGVEHAVHGEAEHHRDEGNEDEDGFLDSGHRFSNR
ncbi:hypothetical protein D3C84_895650 [compost metagenome]